VFSVEPEVVSPEPIPETSLAERSVADLLPIATTSLEAVRLRDSVPLWFHTFALGQGIYTPGLARDHVYRLPVLARNASRGAACWTLGPSTASTASSPNGGARVALSRWTTSSTSNGSGPASTFP
jgi:hypothetical protein